MYTIDEFVKQHEKPKPEGGDPTSRLKAAIRSYVALEYVASDENWDHFLSYIAGAKERFEKTKEDLEQQILGSFDPEETARIKYYYHHALGHISALEWVEALPKAIKENAEIATEIGKEDSPTTSG